MFIRKRDYHFTIAGAGSEIGLAPANLVNFSRGDMSISYRAK
ncbi:hypothetical protein [Oceanobacillus jeddahense]|uniref:Uncharacterized protein n=1 Tax=Oceanobacillus jeddahense TaxID=1462527 RepID=A0ABY5JNN5_9BACI|nr:hypothetical protein [Oceanobacillus jeddahense]UUI01077.1 hypothetical protein NP439_13475 [Oceanobacillus jeddahense]